MVGHTKTQNVEGKTQKTEHKKYRKTAEFRALEFVFSRISHDLNMVEIREQQVCQ